MSNTQIFNLPNGFRGADGELVREVELRKLDGNDEDMVRDKKNLREGNVIDRLLKGCITRLGPVEERPLIEKAYDGFFHMADVTYLLVMLRAWSIGETYSFDHTCPRCDYLGRHRTNLLELPIDEQKEEYRLQEKFDRVVDGHEVTFVPLLAKHGKLMEEIRVNYKSEKGTREMLIQLKKLDGEEVNAKVLKKLDWKLRNRIRETMDSVSGGIDINLAMECAKCDRVYKDMMPVEIRDFFFPVEDTSPPLKAISFRSYGATSRYSELDGDGDLSKSVA